VRGNNASQPVSIAKPSMMLSYDSLETGTGSSNSLRSAIESFSFCNSFAIRREMIEIRVRERVRTRIVMSAVA